MLLDDIATLLQTAGVGTIGTSLFKSQMPATPDTAVALLEYGGLSAEHHMAAGPGLQRVTIEQPSLQVLCRSTDYPTARTKADVAYKALDGYSGVIGGVRYGYISARQSPYLIQRDQNDRVWIGFSCLIKKALSP